MLSQKPADDRIRDLEWMYRAIAMNILTDCDVLWATTQGHCDSLCATTQGYTMLLEANLLPDFTILRQAHQTKKIRTSLWVPTLDM
eukprot:8584223-Heterocapsa_arctica.AAC.1